jgi:TRAP-type C4-dicarboxylate transport system permease small subunit
MTLGARGRKWLAFILPMLMILLPILLHIFSDSSSHNIHEVASVTTFTIGHEGQKSSSTGAGKIEDNNDGENSLFLMIVPVFIGLSLLYHRLNVRRNTSN